MKTILTLVRVIEMKCEEMHGKSSNNSYCWIKCGNKSTSCTRSGKLYNRIKRISNAYNQTTECSEWYVHFLVSLQIYWTTLLAHIAHLMIRIGVMNMWLENRVQEIVCWRLINKHLATMERIKMINMALTNFFFLYHKFFYLSSIQYWYQLDIEK